MRGLKSTIALLVVLLGLVGYIYFVDSKTPANDTVETKDELFPEVEAEDIEEIRITAADGGQSTLKKDGAAWRLTAPVAAAADETEASALATSLGGLEIQRVLDENPPDLTAFGLEPARVDVTFTVKGRSEPQRLLLGEKTPAGGDVYARSGASRRVVLLNSFVESTFDKNAFALRDKRALELDRAKVERLELTSGTTTLRFAKQGNAWRITAPVTARGDFGAIEAAAERLASLQMQAITAERAADLRAYGLERPTSIFTVGLGDGQSASLLLGRTENAVVYAKDTARPLVFTVAPTIVADLVKDVAEYRRKDVFDVRAFTATRVSLARGAETIVLEKTKAADGRETWKNGAGATLDAAKVEELLGQLTSLRASRFETAAPASLAAPALTVTTTFEGGTETVRFAQADGTAVAARADEPGAAVVDTLAFEGALKQIDALK